MKRNYFICSLAFFISIGIAWASDPLDGSPIAYLDGCEVDLNKDGIKDSAMLIKNKNEYELFVIMRFFDGPKLFVINRSNEPRYLSCRYGRQIKETVAGPEAKRGKIYNINGSYLALEQPEVSVVAYFWSESEGKFKEVWLSE